MILAQTLAPQSDRCLRLCSLAGPLFSFFTLSRQFFKQLASGPILLYLGVQYVHIVCHRQQEDLGGYLPVTAQQELPEGVVLLNDTKGSL